MHDRTWKKTWNTERRNIEQCLSLERVRVIIRASGGVSVGRNVDGDSSLRELREE